MNKFHGLGRCAFSRDQAVGRPSEQSTTHRRTSTSGISSVLALLVLVNQISPASG